MIKGKIEVNGQEFAKEIHISGLNEAEQVLSVETFCEALKATILVELNIGEYKVNK